MNTTTHASPYVLQVLLATRPVEYKLTQGSPEWEAHRSSPKLRNASEVGAMLSCDPHATREQLMQAYALSMRGEPTDYKQGIYDSGHHFERLARPLAEAILGDDLYPRVMTRGPLGASLDGSTLLKDTNWEHKRLNDELREALPHAGPEGLEKNRGDDLPKRHRGQMEQQMLVDGAVRCLFTASHWELNQATGEWECKDARHCWYYPDAKLREEVLIGWRQFDEELATYEPQPAVMKAVAAPIEDLPTLVVRIEGRVTESNLEQWRDAMMARIKAINRDLKTDEDFATAKAMVTKLEQGKRALQLLKEQALSQASQILEQFKSIDAVTDTMDETRKALDQLVKDRVVTIRREIQKEGEQKVRKQLQRENERLAQVFGGHHVMPDMTHEKIAADFAKAVKDRRTVKTTRDAVNAEAARACIAVTTLADLFEKNGKVLGEHEEHKGLFADWRTLIYKDPEDCALIVRTRIAEHEAQQQRRQQEEADRQQREAQQRQQVASDVRQPAAGQPATGQLPLGTASRNGAGPYGGGGGAYGGYYRTGPRTTPAPTQQQPAAAQYLTLAELNARLAPLSITLDGLTEFGLDPGGEDLAGNPLFPHSLLPTICDVLIGHLGHVREQFGAPSTVPA